MALFILPTSGFAVGGGGHNTTDPRPPGMDGAANKDEIDNSLIRKINRYRLLSTPPGQIPGHPLSQVTGPFERTDWIYPTKEDLDRTPLVLVVEAVPGQPDLNTQRRIMLHREAGTIRQKISVLRIELAHALLQARQERKMDIAKHTHDRGSPISGSTSIPKLPRAKPALPRTEAEIPAGNPLHMRKGPMTLSPTTQRIMSIRQQISKLRMRLAEIRTQLRQLVGPKPMRHDIPMHAPSVSSAVHGLTNVRSSWLGQPRSQRSGSIAHKAQILRTHWVSNPRPRTESRNFKMLSNVK